MYITLFSILILSISLIGIGRFFEKMLWKSGDSPLITFMERGLLGIIGLSTIGIFLHFFIPLRDWALIGIHALGLISAFWWGFKQKQIVSDKHIYLYVALFLSLIVYLTYVSYAPTPTYDTGLYHLQATLWNREAALSPGIALLHDRFGFNSAWFVFSASLGLPKLWNSSLLLPNTLIFLFILGSLFEYIQKSWSKKIPAPKLGAAIAGLFVAWQFPSLLMEVNSISTDFPTMAIQVYCVFLVLYHKKVSNNLDTFILLLALFATLIKVSSLVFMIGLIVLAVLRNKNTLQVVALRHWRMALFALFLIALWVTRGYIQSGCLIYPLSKSCFELHSWSVSQERANITSYWIESWAKWPGRPYIDVLADWSWLPNWWNSTLSSPIFHRLTQGIVVLVIICIVRSTKVIKHSLPDFYSSNIKGLLVVLAVSLIYWFMSAPDPRFTAGILLSWLLIPLTYFCTLFIAQPIKSWKSEYAAIVLLTYLVIQIPVVGATVRRHTNDPLWVRIPQAPQIMRTNAAGQKIYTPASGDQCWAIELPCTPEFNENLLYFWKNNRAYFKMEK